VHEKVQVPSCRSHSDSTRPLLCSYQPQKEPSVSLTAASRPSFSGTTPFSPWAGPCVLPFARSWLAAFSRARSHSTAAATAACYLLNTSCICICICLCLAYAAFSTVSTHSLCKTFGSRYTNSKAYRCRSDDTRYMFRLFLGNMNVVAHNKLAVS